jgi:hypothetical protein
MRLLLRHEHPGQRVFVDWAGLAGDTGTALQPLSPKERSSYEFARPLYASWDQQIAAEFDVKSVRGPRPERSVWKRLPMATRAIPSV